jgi:hypothetical protein
LTAAKPIVGRMMSTRQVTNTPTRGSRREVGAALADVSLISASIRDPDASPALAAIRAAP